MVKKKVREFLAGQCYICNCTHTTSNGGWIINAEKKLFCHEPCFTIYLNNKALGRLINHPFTRHL